LLVLPSPSLKSVVSRLAAMVNKFLNHGSFAFYTTAPVDCEDCKHSTLQSGMSESDVTAARPQDFADAAGGVSLPTWLYHALPVDMPWNANTAEEAGALNCFLRICEKSCEGGVKGRREFAARSAAASARMGASSGLKSARMFKKHLEESARIVSRHDEGVKNLAEYTIVFARRRRLGLPYSGEVGLTIGGARRLRGKIFFFYSPVRVRTPQPITS
jgi:hypothetical protein